VLRTKSLVLAILVAIFIPMTTAGCFGRFALTRKLYRFNRDLSHDRWVRWFGFLVMSIVPIYAAGMLLDLVLANSVEFWGGSNPFAAVEPRTRYAWGPDGEFVSATAIEPGVIELRVFEAHGEARVLQLVREAESLAAYDERGKLIARVGDRNGVATLLQGAGVARALGPRGSRE
jgi:hypothetical protein